MANVTRGFTYAVNDTVTNTNLHQLVDAATVSSIVSADFTLTTTNPIHIGATVPSDSNSRFWYDTANNIFKAKDAGSAFQPVANGQIFTNKSGSGLVAGDVVVLDTGNAESVTTTTTATNVDVIGVALETIANDATGIIAVGGFFNVSVTGSTDIGDYLFTSTTATKADPSPTFASGAFARALTSSSSSVTAMLFNSGAVQEVPGTETFEIDSGREVTVSTTFGSPTTVNFNSTFSKPPVVVCTSESTTASQEVVVIQTTTTSFTAYGVAATAFNWIACTPGIFQVESGVLVQSGATGGSPNDVPISIYQTGETPAIVVNTASTDDAAGNQVSVGISGRIFGGGTTNDINNAGRSSMITATADASLAREGVSFILFSQTGTVQNGNTATAGGSQDALSSKNFESGTVMEVTSVTPTLTFETAFSAAPAVIISGESRDQSFSAGNWPAQLNAVPSTTVFTARLSTTDARTGFNWIAIDKGFVQVTTAKRIG